MDLQKDLKEFIELLNSNGVDYVIVGAHALAYHGRPRLTKDIDIFINASAENADRMQSVLRQFGFHLSGISREDFLAENRVIQLGVAPNRIDILTSLSGCTFEEVWTGRVPAELGGVPVNFIGREQFLKNKRAAGRRQDLADVEALE